MRRRALLAVSLLSAVLAPACRAGDPAAITGIHLANDRWPDATDMRQFGLDACRIEGAKTDTEKAVALWRWIRIFSTSVRGGIPREPVDTAGKIGTVHDDAYKILNVYGAHWCSGLARVHEYVWRAMGYRATKLFFEGHTVVDAFWRDDDGVERWHTMDASEGWYAFTRDGARIASADDYADDFSLHEWPSRTPITGSRWNFAYWGWIHCPHGAPLAPLPRLALAEKETFYSLWGNEGKPHHNNIGGLLGRKHFEHGPYVVTFGNSRDTFAATFRAGEALSAENVAFAGGAAQADASRPAVLIYRRAFPYVIAESSLRLGCEQSAGASLKVSVSVDGGATWGDVWQAAGEGGRSETVALAAGEPGPASLRGRYDAQVRIELAGGARLTALTWDTVLQHSLFALPTLQPGANRITVRADIPEGRALQVTYEWNDAAGTARRNVARIQKSPAEYTIVCGGTKWDDVLCTKISYANVPAAGEDAVTILEHTGPARNDAALAKPFPTEQIIGDRRPPELVKDPAHYVALLKDRKQRSAALAALRILADPAAAGPIRDAVLAEQTDMRFRAYALQTLAALDGKQGGELAAKVVLDAPDIRYAAAADSTDMWSFKGLAALLAAKDGRAEILPVLAARWRAAPGDAYAGKWSFVKAAGVLGGKPALAPLRAILAPAIESGDPDTIELAAVALGGIGDPSAADLLMDALRHGGDYCRPYVMDALAACGVKQAVPQLARYLDHWDELMRYRAFDALQRLDPAGSREKLVAAAAREQVGWLRRHMGTSLGERP